MSHFQHCMIDAAAPIIGVLGHLAAGELVHFDVLQTGLPSNGWATLMLTSVWKGDKCPKIHKTRLRHSSWHWKTSLVKLLPISLRLFLPNGHRNAPSAVGQHLSRGYHRPQKEGVPTADQADQHPLGVVHGSTGGGRSSSRHLQHAGRPSVPSSDEQMQLQIILCLRRPWRWTGLHGACGLNCPFSACWKPDPEPWARDAFSQDWTQYQG